ncbi:dephospho-CoA kinase [Arthrobacter sp. 35W]|uniref:dephospho-CoA kinase n=1 Tax=Arthrobacter sp. 35W TaxID=1132441 RepID=UPI000417E510|nr:dephospho-CoA kinase [Arthrobacter sp. 35W]
MLSLGLTGGIASGKSLLSARFRELGAVVIDADQLARQVVATGTPGLAAVAAEFGPGVLDADGGLDRPALGAIVFADPDRLKALNAITHPLVRAEAARLSAAAGPGQVVVQDIPLLVETGQGAAFHLVLVVDAPVEQQLARMVAHRGMAEADALARIAAQASREQRLAAADVVIDNSAGPEAALAALDALWQKRLVPFAQNLAAGRCAAGDDAVVPADPAWPDQARRLAWRIAHAGTGLVLGVEHVGPTAVAGRPAPDVLHLRVSAAGAEQAQKVSALLAEAGFPVQAPGHGSCGDLLPGAGTVRHCSADPGRAAVVEIQAAEG